jgi:hypothetical protein
MVKDLGEIGNPALFNGVGPTGHGICGGADFVEGVWGANNEVVLDVVFVDEREGDRLAGADLNALGIVAQEVGDTADLDGVELETLNCSQMSLCPRRPGTLHYRSEKF